MDDLQLLINGTKSSNGIAINTHDVTYSTSCPGMTKLTLVMDWAFSQSTTIYTQPCRCRAWDRNLLSDSYSLSREVT